MATNVTCLADSAAQAETVVRAVGAAGIDAGAISALFPDPQRTHDFADRMRTREPQRAAVNTGGMASGALGWMIGLGIIGWMAGVGLLVIPAGAGSYIAKDPIVAAAGASVVGGLVGTLIGFWISRREAGAFAKQLGAGGIVISVEAGTNVEAERVAGVFRECGAGGIGEEGVVVG